MKHSVGHTHFNNAVDRIAAVLYRKSCCSKSNQINLFQADSKIKIQDNNVQPLTEVQKGCCQR